MILDQHGYYPILAGCLLALLLHDRRWFERLRALGRGAWTAGALALFLVLHFAAPWVREFDPLRAWEVLYGAAVAALLGSVLLGEGPLQQLLRGRALVFVGKLSYGVYLVHVFGVVLAHKLAPAGAGLATSVLAYALACALSVAGAWVLAVLVERNFIRLGRRWSQRVLDRVRHPGPPRPSEAPTPPRRASQGSRQAAFARTGEQG